MPRHQRFVDEYLIDLNATQAAVRAGYSSKTASVQASRLLVHPSIRQHISDIQARASVHNNGAPGSRFEPPVMRRGRKLTPRQRRFVKEYPIDWNAKQAAIRSGYSPRSAEVLGCRLVRHPVIGIEIDRVRRQRSAVCHEARQRVLSELAKIACSDISNYSRPDGSLKSPSEWTPNESACVASYRIRHSRSKRKGTKTVTVWFRLWSKPRALKLLARHLAIDRAAR